MSSSRQLNAVMFTDIVGYTATMGEDRDVAMEIVNLHNETLEDLVPKYNGKIQNFMGDGSLSLFPTASQAITCSKLIQLKLQNEVPIRIGIHDGEVLIENNKAFGSSINIASRIESSGCAGSILFSQSIYEKIKNDSSHKCLALGKFKFKNVGEPMNLYALQDDGLVPIKLNNLKNKSKKDFSVLKIALFLALLLLITIHFIKPDLLANAFLSIPKVDSDLISIAAFPFKISDQEEIKYLEEGMMDLLHAKFTALNGMSALDPIISKSIYDKNNGDLHKILSQDYIKDSNIDYAITGSFLQIGSVLKIIGTITSKDGKTLEPIEIESLGESDLYEGIESFIRQSISLIQEDTNLDFSGTAVSTSTNFDALKSYIQGENARRSGDFGKAHNYYDAAINIDSTFALAWIRLWNNLGFYNVPNRNQVLRKCKQKIKLYRDSLPHSTLQYVDANILISESKFPEAINILKDYLSIYGDNLDVLYLLGDVLFHTNILYNKSQNEGLVYFDKISEYSNLFAEAEFHNTFEAFKTGNSQQIVNYINKYPNSDYNDILEFFVLFSKNLSQEIFTDSLQKFCSENEYLPISALMDINKLPQTITSIQQDKIAYQKVLDNFDMLEYYLLLMQGKYHEAFRLMPNTLTQDFFNRAYLMSEPEFMPITKEMAKEVSSYLDTFSRFNPNQSFHFTARALYKLTLEDFASVEQYQNELAKRISTTKTERAKSMTHYNLYRLRSSLSRKKGENELALRQLDTLYSTIMHWEDYGSVYPSFYSGLKFMEGNILLEEGEFEAALEIFQNMDDASYSFTPMYLHAPIKFLIAYILEIKGEKLKAYDLFKYFLSIYGDCDPFYQKNVQYAKEKILEYEETFL